MDFEAISVDDGFEKCRLVFFAYKAHCDSLRAVSTCSADSMQVSLGVRWNVHTNDQVHVFGVDSAGRLLESDLTHVN